MEVAPYLGRLQEPRQRPGLGGGDLAAILAQLGRDEAEAEGRVDLLLGPAGQPLAGVGAEDPVLVQLQPAAHRPLAQADVVVPGPGEVLQRGPEALRREGAQVHLETGGEHDARLRVAVAEDLLHVGVGDEGLRQGPRVAEHDEVEVSDALPAAAERAHRLHPRGPVALEVARQARDDGLCFRKKEPALGAAPVVQPLADLRLFLLLHPGQRPEAAVGDGLLEVLGGGDAELPPHEADALGSEPGQVQQLEEPRRHLGQQLLVVRAVTGRHRLLELRGDAGAHTGHLLQLLAAAEHLRDVAGQRLDRLAGQPVGTDAEDAFALDLEDIGDLVEDAGERQVVHETILRRATAVTARRRGAAARPPERAAR